MKFSFMSVNTFQTACKTRNSSKILASIFEPNFTRMHMYSLYIHFRLAAQTMVGAGRMVLDTRSHPAVLKDEVSVSWNQADIDNNM